MRVIGSLSRFALLGAVTLGLTVMLLTLPASAASADDGIGVQRDDRFFLRDSLSGGAADRSFTYGRSTDGPLVGDWNRDGRDTVGLRRGSRFYLRNSHSGGPADLNFPYGRPEDTPVIGDWNGDGRDTVGVRRGSWFYLRNSNTSGPANLSFPYGRSDDVPLVGRWTAPPVITTVSEFTTPLVPGQPRNTNIHLAADIIDGDVIAPGSSYLLDQAIGPRTSSRGFVGNGFIDGEGDVISAVGGGVSQMATTFLNAAWFAGIDIEDFRQHTIYFQRYPMCREATLQRNVLDVVVVNDTPHPITVSTSHTSSAVTVSLIGVPWADVSSRVSAPYNVSGGVGGAFSVNCGRTVTYPDGSTESATYSWRYNEGFPG